MLPRLPRASSLTSSQPRLSSREKSYVFRRAPPALLGRSVPAMPAIRLQQQQHRGRSGDERSWYSPRDRTSQLSCGLPYFPASELWFIVAGLGGALWWYDFGSERMRSKDAPEQENAVVDYERLDRSVAIGAATSLAAFQRLKSDGFRSVVNLQLPTESGQMIEENRAAAQRAGMRFYHLPLSPTSPDPQVASQFLAIMSDSTNLPVYIHSDTGKRAASLVMLKHLAADGWPMDRALREARSGLQDAPALEKWVSSYLQAMKAAEQARANMPARNIEVVIHL